MSPFTILSERKYFWSGCSSKMSNNEHALPVLRDSVILAVKHLPLQIIPQLNKRSEDCGEGCTAVVAEEAFDIFKEKQARPFVFEYPCDFKKKCLAYRKIRRAFRRG